MDLYLAIKTEKTFLPQHAGKRRSRLLQRRLDVEL
jgi:hypothetical protein